jgi:hypothetical protein
MAAVEKRNRRTCVGKTRKEKNRDWKRHLQEWPGKGAESERVKEG